MVNFYSVKNTVPNDLVYFELAQLLAREMARMIRFKGNELNKTDIPVEESVTFVMTHAYDKEEDKTIDVVCQKIENGMKDRGLVLATSPASWKFKGISDDTSERISIVLAFMYMKEPAPLNIYTHAHPGIHQI